MKWPFGSSSSDRDRRSLRDDRDQRSLRRGRRSRLEGKNATTVYAAAALVLAHPDQRLLDRLDEIDDAVDAVGAGEYFAPILAHLRRPIGEPMTEDPTLEPMAEDPTLEPMAEERGARLEATSHLTRIQTHYGQEFDYSRRHALNLTYWIDGDTRRRGESLLRYKQAYRDSGLWVDLDGELPDYLPMLLEFAVHEPERGRELLIASRPALELLRFALRDDDLPHHGVVAAICATLPGESPTDRLSVTRMRGWQPPTEAVGLVSAPYAPYPMTQPSVPHGLRLPILDQQEL